MKFRSVATKNIDSELCKGGFFLRKKKKQKSPYFEEKVSQKLSYLDIKFVEFAKTKQNSTFFSYFLV